MNQPRSLASVLRGTTENWLDDQASSISAALAFYCAFSLAPLLIIIVTIAGWIVGGDLAYSYLGSQVTMLFGKQSADLILQAMHSAQSARWRVGDDRERGHAAGRREHGVRGAGKRPAADLGRARAAARAAGATSCARA